MVMFRSAKSTRQSGHLVRAPAGFQSVIRQALVGKVGLITPSRRSRCLLSDVRVSVSELSISMGPELPASNLNWGSLLTSLGSKGFGSGVGSTGWAHIGSGRSCGSFQGEPVLGALAGCVTRSWAAFGVAVAELQWDKPAAVRGRDLTQ